MKVLSPSCKNKHLKYRAHWERFCKFQWGCLIFFTSRGIRTGNMPIVSTVVYIAVSKIPGHSRCSMNTRGMNAGRVYGFWLRFCDSQLCTGIVIISASKGLKELTHKKYLAHVLGILLLVLCILLLISLYYMLQANNIPNDQINKLPHAFYYTYRDCTYSKSYSMNLWLIQH